MELPPIDVTPSVDTFKNLLDVPFQEALDNPSKYIRQVETMIQDNPHLPDSILNGIPAVLKAITDEAGTDLNDVERDLVDRESRYLLERAMVRFVDRELLSLFADNAALANLFKAKIEQLCKKYVSVVNGSTVIPDYREVASNLLTYSLSAVERLGAKPEYINDFQTVPETTLLENGKTYIVMLTCGVILSGTYSNLDEMIHLRLADAESNIAPNRLLAIHSTINDDDFLRGVPLITYDGLSKVNCGYIAVEQTPAQSLKPIKRVAVTTKQKQRKKTKAQSKARRNNRK